MERLNSLSLGTLTALCTLAVVGLVTITHGQQMFSSGPLNEQNRRNMVRGGVSSHAEIGANCSACHVPPWSSESMATRCLDCHTEVRTQLEKRGPLHGLLAAGKHCVECHTEHKGPHSSLTSLHLFDHDCAAFKLTGKHRTLDCAACHPRGLHQGTPQTCVSCHAEPQVHKGRLGTDCAQCHSTSTWTTRAFDRNTFNHDVTRFKLTGKHRSLDCAACHVNQVYLGTPQNCAACHAEPLSHKGKFGTNCANCHSTETWHDAVFRHLFPLNHGGAVKKGGCAICHTVPNDPQIYTCYGCHRHDPGNTKKKHAKLGILDVKDCAVCHPTGRRGRKIAQLEDPELTLCPGSPEVGRCLGSDSWFANGNRTRQTAVGCLSLMELVLRQPVKDGFSPPFEKGTPHKGGEPLWHPAPADPPILLPILRHPRLWLVKG